MLLGITALVASVYPVGTVLYVPPLNPVIIRSLGEFVPRYIEQGCPPLQALV